MRKEEKIFQGRGDGRSEGTIMRMENYEVQEGNYTGWNGEHGEKCGSI